MHFSEFLPKVKGIIIVYNYTHRMTGIKLAFWFLLAQVTDMISTYYAIKILSLEEQNPLANSYFEGIGIGEFMVIKLGLVLSLLGLYLLAIKYYREWIWTLEKSLQVGNFGMWIVATLNIVMILSVDWMI